MSHPTYVFSGNNVREQSSQIIVSQSYTIHPREPKPEPTSRIIYPKSRSFVGREDVLVSIEHSLHGFGIAALTGPGGIGKTEAAIEYCHRFHESHQHFWIFWVHAGSREEFKNDYRGIALKLKLISSIASSDDVVFRLLGDWFQDSENWLLVVDNADCYKDFYGPTPSKSSEPAFLAGYLPCFEPHRKRILFTSRDVDLGIKLSEGSLVIVDRLSNADSSNLFRKRIAASRCSQKSAGGGDLFLEEDVQALLATLDYLPLAITYAASYIGEKGNISIQDYTSKLQESDEALISYLEQPGAPLRFNSSTPRSVVQTWIHSLNLILAKNAGAAHLLCLMACMERNAIHAKHLPPWMVDTSSLNEDRYWSSSSDSDAGSEDPDFFSPSDIDVKSEQRDNIGFPKNEADRATALSDLEALSLIKYHADDNVFSIHRFVQVLTIYWLEAKQMDLGVDERISYSFYTFQQAIARFLLTQITFANRVFMTDEDFKTTSELLPHAEWLLLHFEAFSSCTLTIKKRLLDKVSRFYMIRGDLHASKDACQMLLDITRGDDLHVKLTMVAVLNLLGELDAANEILQELGIAFYPESQELLFHDVLPLTLLLDGGKNAAVVQTAREILKHVQTYNAQDVHPIALAIVNASFALCLLLEGAEPENVEVQECINKTFALLKETKGSEFWHFAGKIFAQTLAAAGQWHDAELMARQAIEHSKITCGSSHTETMACKTTLARVLCQREWNLKGGNRLDSVREVVEMSQRLCSLDILNSDPNIRQSFWMHLAISTHAELLMLLYFAMFLDVENVLNQSKSALLDKFDQATLRHYMEFFIQRRQDLSCIYNKIITYLLMAIEGSSRIYGETSPTTNEKSLFLRRMYLSASSPSAIEQHLCDRSRRTIAAIQHGMRIDNAFWPKVFDLYCYPISPRTNLDYYASVLLASIRADKPNLQSNVEIGRLYLSLLRQVEDKAMLQDVYEAYTKESLVRHTAICDSCDQTIFTLRHACSTCDGEGFDLCSDCVVNTQEIHPGHALAPVFIDRATGQRIFSKRCLMRGRAPIPSAQPDEHSDAYSYLADPHAAIDVTVSKHWRMRIAIERNYESEPDEGGRIRTRFDKHCDRGRSARFAIAKTSHRRQQRSKSHVLRREREVPVQSRDLVPATFGDKNLWKGLGEDSEELLVDASMLEILEEIKHALGTLEAQQRVTSEKENKYPMTSLESVTS